MSSSDASSIKYRLHPGPSASSVVSSVPFRSGPIRFRSSLIFIFIIINRTHRSITSLLAWTVLALAASLMDLVVVGFGVIATGADS
jgi:hypothetical protein